MPTYILFKVGRKYENMSGFDPGEEFMVTEIEAADQTEAWAIINTLIATGDPQVNREKFAGAAFMRIMPKDELASARRQWANQKAFEQQREG